MVLLALLVAAVACLAVGLALASAGWLIGSLVASALAAVALYRSRSETRTGMRDRPAAVPPADATPTVPGPAEHVWVVDGRPDFHADDCPRLDRADAEAIPLAQATADGFAPCAACAPLQAPADLGPGPAAVWVVDGRPDFHRPDCPRLAPDSSEHIPLAQATADGFTPCATCRPLAAESPLVTPGSAHSGIGSTSTEATEGDVWVVDGQPDFHRFGCGRVGVDAQPIRLAQASEDGFLPCADCQPLGSRSGELTRAVQPLVHAAAATAATAAMAGEAAASPVPIPQTDKVWVIDGRPRYHIADCLILSGKTAVSIPHREATTIGFMPCSLCEPNGVRAS